jgi:hypothetical protein
VTDARLKPVVYAYTGKGRALVEDAIERANDGSPTSFHEWREAARVSLRGLCCIGGGWYRAVSVAG